MHHKIHRTFVLVCFCMCTRLHVSKHVCVAHERAVKCCFFTTIASLKLLFPLFLYRLDKQRYRYCSPKLTSKLKNTDKSLPSEPESWAGGRKKERGKGTGWVQRVEDKIVN